MEQGTIFRIKKYALHDGPGIRTTVFLKGCPLSCRWCHNPESISPAPQPMERPANSAGPPVTIGNRVSVEEVMEEIEKDRLFYDESGGGVTFSGGEPFLQPKFLKALLAECRERELHTTLDTAGLATRETVEELIPLTDFVLFDLKLMDEALHRKYTGVSNSGILSNLKRIAESTAALRIRIPLIPGLTDTEDNMDRSIEFIKSLGPIGEIDLLPYHRIAGEKYRRLGIENQMARVLPLSQEKLTTIKDRFTRAGFRTTIGG